MKKIGTIAALLLLSLPAQSQVHWVDTLAYQKPRTYPLPMPDEASVANKYWVSISTGSGSACSQAAPCASLNAVAGKPGTNGDGPAYIYVKGNGYLNITASTLAGSSGNEIVIKPWPGDYTPTVWTAQGGCGIGNANTISGSGTHHVIFDGGPRMLLQFRGSACTTSQNGYTVVVNSNDITFYRVQVNANGSQGPALGIATGNGVTTNNFSFINSELYGATRYYGVYTGGGATCCSGTNGHNNLVFRNSIFRNIDGRGIQLEPRGAASGVIVDGNVFRDVGYNRTGASITVSSCVQPAGACCGTVKNITVTNNLAFDLGGGFASVEGGQTPYKIIGNTVYDYAKASGTPNVQMHGIGVFPSGSAAEARNNIILKKNNAAVCAFDCDRSGGLNAASSNNICESSAGGCGPSAVNSTAVATFLSATPDSLNFLKLLGTANAVNAGTNTGSATPGTAKDFTGKNRGLGGAYDIGAMESGTGSDATRPKPPTPGN